MIARLALLVLVACSSKREDVGGECKRDKDCTSGNCFASKCQSGAIGSPCSQDQHCTAYGATCVLGTCGDHVAASKWREERSAIEVRSKAEAKAKLEAEMLAASGVEPTAEVAPPPGPADGPHVRTANATGYTSAFAACRSDERLVGGGCKTDYSLQESYPSEVTADDTVGARWNCKANAHVSITAYALCSRVSP